MADGEAIDWSSADARLVSTPSRAVARSLKAIAAVAETSTRARLSHLVSAEGYRLPLWAWLVVGLALVQVLLGLIGYAVGVPDQLAVPPGFQALGTVLFSAVGLGLLIGARNDRRASYLGSLLVTIASALSLRGMQWLKPQLVLSHELRFLRLGLHPELFGVLFLWLFAREFPRVVRLSPLERPLAWGVSLAAVFSIGSFLASVGSAVLNPDAPANAPVLGVLTRNHPWGVYWLGSLGLALAAMVFALLRRRDASQEERRRVMFLVGGLVLGIAPMVLIVIAHYVSVLLGLRGLLADRGRVLFFAVLSYAFMLTVPFTAAYAVRAHRVFQFKVVVRRTVQHLLARTTLLVLTAVPLAGLVVHLYLNRHQSLAALTSGGPGLTLVLLATGASILLLIRAPVLRALNQALFREEADLQGALARVGPRLRTAETTDEVLDHLMAETQGVFQAPGAFFLLGSSEGDAFRPARGTARPLKKESALVALTLEDGKPITTDPRDPHSIFPWLPEAERQWVVDSNVALVAPSKGASGEVFGFLGLGPKRSDQPFSRDEHAFVEALCTTVSMALENRALRGSVAESLAVGASDEPAKECPQCGLVAASEDTACPCGATLRKASIPCVLQGKFRLERVLGRGGMGVVYLAEDLALVRRVALKTLPRISAELSLRLRSEARSMAAVTHPNLALIYGAESWRGVPVLVMEYLAGGTLTQRLDEPAPVVDTLKLGATLAEALDTMHAQGLLHRDVKPSNIGFTTAGVPKLLDFGLARILDESLGALPPADNLRGPAKRVAAKRSELTGSDHIVGTPLYLPPEALSGYPASAAQDLWSLSMVLYEAIAGQHPLRTPTGLDLKAVGKPLPDIRQFRQDCPRPVAEMFQETLAPEMGRRFTTAAQMRERLASLIAGAHTN